MDSKTDPFFDKKRYINSNLLEQMHSTTVKSVLEELHRPRSATLLTACNDEIIKTFKGIKDDNCKFYPKNAAIGIDLGTTYSCVGIYLRGKVTIIPNYNTGYTTTSSYVKFGKSSKGKLTTEVGDNVKSSHDDGSKFDIIFDAKRIIGRSFNDPDLQMNTKMWPFEVTDQDGVPTIEAQGKSYHPEQISALILKEMKKSAEKVLGVPVTEAVITVPAYFNDGQKQATLDAGKIAGLKVLELIHEPTAAALAYWLEMKNFSTKKNVVVFDFGGGTLDVSVLTMEDGKIDVKSIEGDAHLGELS